jgi:glycosyltransferase involved in cell wall biosynthesis
MTVGVVCHFPPPPGGMPGQAEALVEGLRREGLRALRIPTNLGGGPLAQRLDRLRGIRTLLRVPVFLLRLAAALPAVDVLHVASGSGVSFFVFAVPAILAGRLSGRRVVFHYHSGAAESFLRRWRRVAPRVMACAHDVLVPSPFLVPVLARHGLAAHVLPNVCDLSRFEFVPRTRFGPQFLISRHLDPIYNVGCTIRAFALVRARHADAQLEVLGGGSEEARLRALAAELGVADSVRFHGYVDHARVPAFYRQASIFVNSSNVDNAPLAILEAFASGLPVVTTAAGGIPVMVDDGRTGLLVPLNDHRALAAAMIEMVENPAKAARLAKTGRAVVERHAWPSVFEQLIRTYAAPAPGAATADLIGGAGKP